MVMKSLAPIAVVMLALAWVSLVSAQRPPAAPKNLRILSGGIVNPSIPNPHRHDYFNSLVALKEHFRSWSLRDQTQLDGLTNLGTSSYFTYAFGSDGYSAPQDGA